MRKKTNEKRLRIIPLGGLGEIGKNMTVYEYDKDMIVVDMGSSFPGDDMPGVDLVIPDTTYLQEHRDRLRGYVITHGHEDHIGAAPYVLRDNPAPVYGTRLTLALVEHKLKEHKLHGVELHVIKSGDVIELGAFTVEFIHVNHSITGAVALAIHTPIGTVVHTGDFKVDYTPIDDHITDLGTLAKLGNDGVLALLCDSTNVERPGYTMSERKVGETFNTYFQKADARIIVAMFASNIHRIQQVVDVAVRYNRRVCLIGRSMINVSKVAMQLGELQIPEGRLISVDELERYDDNEVVIITTGSQGEEMSGLARIAFAEHKKLNIRSSDMVIISATPIPGNEKSVSRVINQLVSCGADVVYEALAEVHVSGHACQEELKLMHTLIKPRFFIPVHGETRHLYQHAELAKSLGMDEHNIMIGGIGNVIELTPAKVESAETVQAGAILVDGLSVGDIGSNVLKERKHLSQDGLLIIVLVIDFETGAVVSGPDVFSRGFVFVKDSDETIANIKKTVLKTLDDYSIYDVGTLIPAKAAIRDNVQRYVYGTLKRSPMIIPIVMDI